MVPPTARTAIVTGGSGGLGGAISRRLAADGCAVAVHFHANPAKASAVVDAIVAAGGHAFAVGGDIGEEADAKRIVADTVATLGRLDILVNNAGTIIRGPMGHIPKADLAAQFSTNVIGAMLMCQEAMRHLPDGGRIINISSNLATRPPATAVPYAASKAALNALTEGLAKELGPRGITVNAVAPGGTRTEMIAAVEQAVIDQLIATTPLGRLGEPDDIADVVAFLASDAARWVTARTLVVDGGWI